MRSLLWFTALLGLACEAEQGPLRCSMDPPLLTVDGMPVEECRCDEHNDPVNAGAVVVRWRAMDIPTGRLFQRGQCCCAPDLLAACAADDCQRFGTDCPLSPAWIVPYVDLLIRPMGDGTGVGGRRGPCVIRTRCSDAELTTAFCLREGAYDLALLARVGVLSETFSGDMRRARFIFPDVLARVPPATRRVIRAGQIVNLDGVVLGVNSTPAGPIDAAADGAVPDGGT